MTKKSLTLFLALSVLVISPLAVHASLCANRISDAVDETGARLVEQCVIQGSTQYFYAYAEIMSLCADYEDSGLRRNYDFSGNLARLNKAIDYLGIAKEKYTCAGVLASKTGYSHGKISRLKAFDYDGFAAASQLNDTVKEKVKYFLRAGDVTGFYNAFGEEVSQLVEMLEDVRKTMEANIKPTPPQLWKVLQKISTLTLFGNYTTVMGQTAFGNQL